MFPQFTFLLLVPGQIARAPGRNEFALSLRAVPDREAETHPMWPWNYDLIEKKNNQE
jgi:hypothetical protein